MKSVVVEIKGENAAFLKDDGTVVIKRNKNYSIGDVVIVREKSLAKKLKVAVAAAMFFMIASVGVAAYETPYYYVSLDVNPGILLKVNLFEKVIGVEGVNQDAVQIIQDLDLKNKGIETALCNAIERIKEKGYFIQNNNIIIAASSKNNAKAQQLAQRLKDAAQDEVTDEGINADVDSRGIGYEMVQNAKQWNITPGKYNIITHLLKEEVNDVNAAQSIKELMSRYKTNKGSHDGSDDGEQIQEQTQNQSNGNQNDNANTNNKGKK
ncbi:MAG: hypothetical protein GYA50_01450 [Eubacteriaceae bacterium]|nr:hypothetical protein [Eubacteriaceae bacterium]